MRRFLPWLSAGFLLCSSLLAGARMMKRQETVFSQTKTSYLPSEDGRWLLIGSRVVSADQDPSYMLQLQNRETSRTTVVKEYDRFIGVGWSPDSKAFFLNDAIASDIEVAYIYRVDNSSPLELNSAILEHDPKASAAHFDHAYFQVRGWTDRHTVMAEYCGHSSGAAHNQQGYFLYKVVLDDKDASVRQVVELQSNVHDLDLASEECLP